MAGRNSEVPQPSPQSIFQITAGRATQQTAVGGRCIQLLLLVSSAQTHLAKYCLLNSVRLRIIAFCRDGVGP